MLTAMGDVMREAYKRGWISTRDGNISVFDPHKDILYITPTGVRKTIIHPESIVKLPFKEGKLVLTDSMVKDVDGNNCKPSGELDMHCQIHAHSKHRKSVVHLHPTNIVAALFAGYNLQALANKFPELNRYTKVAKSVPVLPVTSKELADATHESLFCGEERLRYDVVGQAGHGVCAVGTSPWDAFEHIERLEHICEIVLKSGVIVEKDLDLFHK